MYLLLMSFVGTRNPAQLLLIPQVSKHWMRDIGLVLQTMMRCCWKHFKVSKCGAAVIRKLGEWRFLDEFGEVVTDKHRSDVMCGDDIAICTNL